MKRAAKAEVHAPPPALPLAFIGSSIPALLAGGIWLTADPGLLTRYHYGPDILAVTHVVVLGWLCTVIFGVLYQFVPVLLETSLYDARLGRWHLALHVPGWVSMGVGFRTGRWSLVAVGGILVTAGACLLLYNIGRTLIRCGRWGVVPAGVAAALAWLGGTLLAGLLLTAARLLPMPVPDPLAALHAHAHLGCLGFFVLLLMAVSYRMIPLFTVGEIANPRRAAASLVLLHAGTLGVVAGIVLSPPWRIAAGILVAAGLGLYGWEIHRIVRSARRRELDPGLKCLLTALALLAPCTALGLYLAWPGTEPTPARLRLEGAYGFLVVFGVVTGAVLGLLYKVVSFLVWFIRHRPRLGNPGVPAPADLYSPRVQSTGYRLFLGGVALTTVAIGSGHEAWVRAGNGILLAGLLVTSAGLAGIVIPRRRAVQTATDSSAAISRSSR